MKPRLKVLLVQNSAEAAGLLLRELERGGYQCTHQWVKNRQEMGQALEEQLWDVVIADYALSHFSGLEALRLIKERGIDLPFIIFSDQISEETAVEAMKAGAHNYIAKGNLSRLTPAIQRELREAEIRREKKQSEKYLRASEERFNKIFDASPDLMSILSIPDMTFLEINQSWLVATGYRREDVIGRTPLQLKTFLHVEDQVKLMQLLRQEGAIHSLEIPIRKVSGETGFVLISVSIITLDDKPCALTVAKDITHLKGIQKAFETSEARFQAMFEESLIGIALVNQEGRFMHVNPAFQKMLDYSKEELIGMDFRQCTYSEDVVKNIMFFKQMVTGHLDHYQMEKRYQTKDGRVVWSNLSVSAMRDDQRRFNQAIIFVQDINDRKKNEAKLRQLASIVESSDDAIISKDPEGMIVSWNYGAEHIYGYKGEEVIGRHFSFLCLEYRSCEVEVMEAIRQGGRLQNFETVRQRKDGTAIHVSITISPIYDTSGKLIGISSITRDITRQKEIEKEMLRLDRLNLVGEMAAGISHEVRNPMTTVRGFLQMLSEKGDCAKYKDYFQLMIEELDRANSIISEFLSIGRNKASEMKVQNLNEIVLALAPLIQAHAVGQEKDVYVETGYVPDLLLNDKEIRQVILNLARNGLEAMQRGCCLSMRTYTDKDEVIFAVQDQGTGISPEVMEKLGTPFFTTKEKGTGLGLATCYSIVARHKGTIQVETGPSGTNFLVKFIFSGHCYT